MRICINEVLMTTLPKAQPNVRNCFFLSVAMALDRCYAYNGNTFEDYHWEGTIKDLI